MVCARRIPAARIIISASSAAGAVCAVLLCVSLAAAADDPSRTVECNANGFVVAPGLGGGAPLTLGLSCGSFQGGYGSGTWCRDQDGIRVRKGAVKENRLPDLDLPACEEHSEAPSCPC